MFEHGDPRGCIGVLGMLPAFKEIGIKKDLDHDLPS